MFLLAFRTGGEAGSRADCHVGGVRWPELHQCHKTRPPKINKIRGRELSLSEIIIDDHIQTTHSGEITVPFNADPFTDDDISDVLGR